MRPLLAAVLLAAACGPREGGPVGAGSTVTLDYELSADGRPVESSAEHGEPLVLVQGSGQVPAAVDAALLGLRPGDEKTVTLPPELAFGPPDLGKLEFVPLSKFGDMAAKLKPGAMIGGMRDGKAAEARVVSVKGGKVELDFNHPLAGKTVVYKFRVLKTRSR